MLDIATFWMMLALAAQRMENYHLDVKYAFLNGYLHEEIFVEQQEGFKVNVYKKTTCTR